MADRYKELLRNEVRMVKRDLRNHLISEKEVEEYRSTLPDVSENARFLSQDGTECIEPKREQLLNWHHNGWESIFKEIQEDPEPIKVEEPEEVEEMAASVSEEMTASVSEEMTASVSEEATASEEETTASVEVTE